MKFTQAMKLTAIKIRGRGSKKDKSKPQPDNNPPRGKIRGAPDDDGESSTAALGHDRPPSRKRTKAVTARAGPATIEMLPTEILERIIMMSENINFLRASLRIGKRFSNPSFLNELVEAAFAPVWDQYYGVEFRSRFWADGDIVQDLGNPTFQVRVLPASGSLLYALSLGSSGIAVS
jgi:hypothetical protein